MNLQDLAVIGVLIFLEGILSIDNALVLALLVRHLPKPLQRKALTYGLVGAVIFRLTAIFLASHLIRFGWVKIVGGAYLLWLAIHHFFLKKRHDPEVGEPSGRGFWKTVIVVELTDIAFAVDSILAAVALTPKIWLIATGGILGIILLRFAATLFIGLLEKFPGFETTAFLLITVIGGKITLEGFRIPWLDFHDTGSAPFWVFWATMLICFLLGFKRKDATSSAKELTPPESQL